MKNLLVPTDFSESARRAFPFAREVASFSGESKIHLVTVVQEAVPVAAQCEFGVGFIDTAPWTDEEAVEADRELKKIRETHFADQAVETQVLRGVEPIASEIAHYARQNAIDLIIIATHGRTGFRHLLLGSVAEHLLREAPCPVLVVPEQKEERG